MTTQPLDPTEDRTWALLVGMMTWLPAALDSHLQELCEISHAEYSVLRWLDRSEDGALHMSQLADTTSVTPSHLSRIVARLEKRGLVARTPDPSDGRYTLALLTDAGGELIRRTDLDYAQLVRDLLLDHLPTGDRERLDLITSRVLGELRPDCLAAHS